jgi:predicted membrane protein
MTIYAGHFREMTLLAAASVIFSESTMLIEPVKVAAVVAVALVFILHMVHLIKAIRHPEAVRYVE